MHRVEHGADSYDPDGFGVDRDSAIKIAEVLVSYRSRSEHQRALIKIGDELNKVEQYEKVFDISGDPVTSEIMVVTYVAYQIGIMDAMHLESSMFLLRQINSQYLYGVALRALIEVTGRVHKAAKVFDNYVKTKDLIVFSEAVRRLKVPFRPGGGDGYNVMTLVQSLADRIPEIKKYYDDLSQVAHGDLTDHIANNHLTYRDNMRGTPATVIVQFEDLLVKLRAVLLDDLRFVVRQTRPLAKRYELKLAERS